MVALLSEENRNPVAGVDKDGGLAVCPHTRAAAARWADLCVACAERLAHHSCDTCEKRICNACVVLSLTLTVSFFCSDECREEAELAAEQARATDTYARWR